MVVTLIALSVLSALSALAAEQVHCPLKVIVRDPAGRSIFSPVIVREANGTTIEKEHKPGGVDFCEVGVLPVTVRVGGPGTCNEVAIHEVPLQWSQQYVLTVTRDLEPCLVDQPPPPSPLCQVLIRIRDSDGTWISNGLVNFVKPSSRTLITDRFGRTLLVVPLGSETSGEVQAHGFARRPFQLTCSEKLLEHVITLSDDK